MLGLQGRPGLSLRRLSDQDKDMSWGELSAHLRGKDGSLALALCQTARSLALEDILDAGSALDQFILELFQSHGHETKLGSQGASVLVNPPDGQSLANYDGVLVLRSETAGEKS
jgi:voltage-gated potassium channel